MKVKSLHCTGSACPTEYEGHLEDGRMFYFRYRWGRAKLTISKTPTLDVMQVLTDGETLYAELIGDEFDGQPELQEVEKILTQAGFELGSYNVADSV